MDVTRDIVKDLLAVYLAGDASSDTRAVVEEWLKRDPELARQAAEARQDLLPPVATPAASAQKRALARTRRGLRLRSLAMGAAIYFTLLPLTVVFDRNGFKGLLIDDWTGRSVALGIAALLWGAFFAQSRRVKVTGL
jgi:anti-sigma factor RsiW